MYKLLGIEKTMLSEIYVPSLYSEVISVVGDNISVMTFGNHIINKIQYLHIFSFAAQTIYSQH